MILGFFLYICFVKKFLVLFLTAAISASCLVTTGDEDYNSNDWFRFEFFHYSEETKISLEDNSVSTYDNTLCTGGGGEYCWIIEKTTKANNRTWFVLKYAFLDELIDDLTKLSSVSFYGEGTAVSFGFAWDGAEEMSRVTKDIVNGETILTIHTTERNISCPEKFIKNALDYVKKYKEVKKI